MSLTPEAIYELFKKYGPLLLVVVWLKNDNENLYNRLDVVEERLYECYEARMTSDMRMPNSQHREMPVRRKNLVAVLPCNPIGKIKTC